MKIKSYVVWPGHPMPLGRLVSAWKLASGGLYVLVESP